MLYKFREVQQNYSQQQRVIYPPFTNGWVLKNEGNTILILDSGDTLNPGDSKSIGGNAGEIYDGIININFKTPTPAPVPVINSAVFTFKYYKSLVIPKDNPTGNGGVVFKEIPLVV